MATVSDKERVRRAEVIADSRAAAFQLTTLEARNVERENKADDWAR